MDFMRNMQYEMTSAGDRRDDARRRCRAAADADRDARGCGVSLQPVDFSLGEGCGAVRGRHGRRVTLVSLDTDEPTVMAEPDWATKPEYRQMFEMDAEQGGRPDDAEVCRSIASIPIRRPGGGLFGVLVATSNRPGRFWPQALQEERAEFDSVEPLRVCAATLAILIQATNLSTTATEA